MGGKLPFAAPCPDVLYAQIVTLVMLLSALRCGHSPQPQTKSLGEFTIHGTEQSFTAPAF